MNIEKEAIKRITKLLEDKKIEKEYALKIVDGLKTEVPRKMRKLFREYKMIKRNDPEFLKFNRDIIYARILCIVKRAEQA